MIRPVLESACVVVLIYIVSIAIYTKFTYPYLDYSNTCRYKYMSVTIYVLD